MDISRDPRSREAPLSFAASTKLQFLDVKLVRDQACDEPRHLSTHGRLLDGSLQSWLWTSQDQEQEKVYHSLDGDIAANPSCASVLRILFVIVVEFWWN